MQRFKNGSLKLRHEFVESIECTPTDFQLTEQLPHKVVITMASGTKHVLTSEGDIIDALRWEM
jgi:uncharacterized protein YlzI (FlbEa/FlbD family)